ncbi:MAG: response regulator [Deltaproteobacteria bacterium]|nr:response regulator [Deltaproteobacteria bacterium]
MRTHGDRTLLIVEDSPEDLEATLRALRRSGFSHAVAHCADGEEALDYLHRRGRFAAAGAAPRPDLVLLDLNLPGTSGREVLAEVKSTERLRSIPIVVFTTSAADRDVDACYRTGANGYVQKPVGVDALVSALQCFDEFWFGVARLPTPEREGFR